MILDRIANQILEKTQHLALVGENHGKRIEGDIRVATLDGKLQIQDGCRKHRFQMHFGYLHLRASSLGVSKKVGAPVAAFEWRRW